MSPNEKAFHKLDKSFKLKVQSSNKHLVNVNSIGIFIINAKNVHNSLKKILYVPDLKINLLSVAK